MKIKKYYSIDFKNQIWRLLISGEDKLVIESRNPETKEAYFHCLDINNKKFLFKDFQLGEKYYIGIETIYKEIIYYHIFPKPDLPNHKKIIAFDINSQKILWINHELSFLFAYNDKIYAFQQGYDERYYFALNYLTGNLIEDFGNNHSLINSLRKEYDGQIDLTNYIFPQVFTNDGSYLSKFISEYFSSIDVIGNIEYGLYKTLLLLSFHTKNSYKNLKNNFIAVNLENKKSIIFETLNVNTKSFLSDSFFMYKNFLILLKEKNGLIIYKVV